MVFTDESRFLLFRNDGPVRVQRQAHDAWNEVCVHPTIQADAKGITIWGAFHAGGKCDLHVLNGSLNQHKYCEILDQKLLQFSWATFSNNFVFQDDN